MRASGPGLVVLLSSWLAGMTPDTCLRRAVLGVDASFMSLLLHERGIHALWFGTDDAGVTEV
jgi:hypothetical protein